MRTIVCIKKYVSYITKRTSHSSVNVVLKSVTLPIIAIRVRLEGWGQGSG